MNFDQFVLVMNDVFILDNWFPTLSRSNDKQFKDASYLEWSIGVLCDELRNTIGDYGYAEKEEYIRVAHNLQIKYKLYEKKAKNDNAKLIFKTGERTMASVIEVLNGMED